MEIKVVNLSDLKFNLKIWKSELKFHEKELNKFENKLEEIACRQLGMEAMAPLEGFQNKLITEREVIGKLRQRIRKKRNLINTPDLSDEVRDRIRFESGGLAEDMKTYIKLHYELKEDLMDYLLKWL